ncbi:UDP-N-acetylmuramoylalanine--D-glutamate ligase [Caldalkalibacillus uzonensis]|uniref:UDP-N-acetylmuramoylalanine--D-glutamate ligase n=1 Tax=Caldalkalibacillus uzonensis TaxID=353224 RepID=A0ABU0CS20_9BACI|nr:UDP-N-acetylmuramoyl-L-alanine--D-glutamate ligase [Caldalkalibacillus uzonensis]MDQ0339220.1 UDP-N-acetylmuramoylalanine--D-glutamate ligase [Caldalkalibacillus uzonensis]
MKNKHVLVLGLAKSGFAVAKLLVRYGAIVTVNEKKPRQQCEGVAELEELGVKVVCGSHPLSLLEQPIDLIVKNPGIPYCNPLLQEAGRKKIPIVTEVEVGYLLTRAPIIGITGSNGKTTTTTLIYEMLKGSERSPLIAGNIGTVFCEVAAQAGEDQWLVTELSSFQLLGTMQFHPKIGVLLNIFDAHLDYHGSKQAYIEAKAKLFAHQTPADLAVFNLDQEETRRVAEEVRAQIAWFSMHGRPERGAYLDGRRIKVSNQRGEVTDILAIDELKLPGAHNLENVLAAVTVSLEAGAKVERVREVLRTFTGVAHRLQFVRELHGVRYYNDSKATNALATKKAIEAFPGSVVLIAGGLDRGDDYHELEDVFQSNLKALIVYGQVAQKLAEVGHRAGVKHVNRVDNVIEAVNRAYQVAEQGDTVLLSPAAASWDQFSSFEERGDMFTDCVHMLR